MSALSFPGRASFLLLASTGLTACVRVQVRGGASEAYAQSSLGGLDLAVVVEAPILSESLEVGSTLGEGDARRAVQKLLCDSVSDAIRAQTALGRIACAEPEISPELVSWKREAGSEPPVSVRAPKLGERVDFGISSFDLVLFASELSAEQVVTPRALYAPDAPGSATAHQVGTTDDVTLNVRASFALWDNRTGTVVSLGTAKVEVIRPKTLDREAWTIVARVLARSVLKVSPPMK
ncbi:MAG: hypothetical protein HY791_07240 [Deltaproteobacteria bacterium]|nr:hypothetical protein [Deltaproteobacteria bacterium]